jgi:GT2 family glycosyltransferase
MVDYILKFIKLNKSDKLNFIIYYDLSKIFAREQNIFSKILIKLLLLILRYFRFFFFKLKKIDSTDKIRTISISQIYSNKLNKENFFFKNNFVLIIYGIDDISKLSLTLKSLNLIKKNLIKKNIQLNLKIFFASKNILSNEIKKILKKNNITEISLTNDLKNKVNYITFLVSGTILKYNSFLYLFNSITKFENKTIIYFNEEIFNYKHREKNFFKKKVFKKYSFSEDFLENFNHIGLNFTVRKKSEITKYIKSFINNENPFDFLLSSSLNLKKKDYLLINKTLSSVDHNVLEKKIKFNLENINVIKKYHKKKKIKSSIKYHKENKHLDINYKPIKKKKISIIIPASGKILNNGKDLLLNLLDGLYNKTNYSNFEVIIIDHNALNNKQIKQIKKYKNLIRIKLNKLYDLENFNFSKNCNIGAQRSRSKVLLFLNDDIEIIDKFWLDYMVGQLEKDHVGIVGSKLYYPDYTIQHAGVEFWRENPYHVLNHQKDKNFYESNSYMVRNYKAVTGACLMIRKNIYKNVNGFDENHFKTNYSDTDLCLKVYKQGFTVVMDPKSKLIHLTSQSRKDAKNVPLVVLQKLKDKWQNLLDDRYSNKN